ncbi:CvpA family protein [Anaerocolumna sp. MB42-C2]|uniref:CvpA family protein n=1 Tax=Anaerocolumna sp. MB42-C2 TaxID=3070997 RepID=UPI0027E10C14|nr:CvpA family protein [Anaerocolumna sp. MB42-C2]WMJ88321.1 CvpA family protein [Anaerocolumna sp. MB42-C2]
MLKSLKIFISIVIPLIAAYIYYYITLPAVNIHSPGFWFFIIGALVVFCVVIGLIAANRSSSLYRGSVLKSKLFTVLSGITIIVVLIYIVGSILSSPMINAKKYQQMLKIKDSNFTEDIKEISLNKIPILDKDSAALLGSRKMGSIVEYVSQFEVGNNYTQINFKGIPTRVSPLQYGSFFKWISNRSEGIPAYMQIDMTTQEVNLMKLTKGIHYSESEYFGRNIHRYLRFNYPTYIFDTINFEINDEGIPYWICPVKDYTIGLFGGQTIGKVVMVNAITGETKDYSVSDVPKWVDRVFSAELLISLYDYYGTLRHGYWNSVISQKDALQTTDGYNYVALNDDVWVYTGVTSVARDESNVGFVLMNQRTAETRFYPVSGAEEYSAMASAEGQVQHLGYRATFPLLLNIGGEPSYFIALKDAAGLVKKYAMVNISQYQIVAIGDTVNECEKIYLELMKSNNIKVEDTSNLPQITGTITKIAEGVVDGNSHYYILLNSSNAIFDVEVVNFINIIKYNVGDTITFSYSEGTESNTVLGVK